MNPEMIRKIDAVLEQVKDPESGLSISQLGLVKRVRYVEDKKILYVFTDFQSHMPDCKTCVFIAKLVAERILQELTVAFHLAFPDCDITFL